MLNTAELGYHVRQYDAPYRSTMILREFIARHAGRPLAGTVLDVGCGAGANLFWMDRVELFEYPQQVAGIDADPALVDIARERNRAMSFVVGDFLDPLPRADYVLSIQVLSFIEDWRPALKRLLGAARVRLFVTSLFWDGVSTHTHATDAGHREAHYNVIEAGEFEQACAPREVVWEPFLSDLAAAGPAGRLGSYTQGWHDFSGPLHLPWRIAMVR